MPLSPSYLLQSHELAEFHNKALVLDVHVHGKDATKPTNRWICEAVFKRTMPPFCRLSALREGRVDGGVVAAVGHKPLLPFGSNEARMRDALRQLRRLKADAEQSGGGVSLTGEDILRAKEDGVIACVLGLEGGFPVGDRIENLERLYNAGVRVLTLVHLEHNHLATVETSWGEYWLPWERRKKKRAGRGLSAFGEKAVRWMNDTGVIIDLSHADRETTMDVARLSDRPVISSHTGARSVADFHRYISDGEIRAIASTGGVIGLWPMYFLGKGMPGPEDFIRHAAHILDVAGEDHLAIGTDANGIPGVMEGYGGVQDAPLLTALLFEAGLNEGQVRKALGLNFLRVMKEVVGQ